MPGRPTALRQAALALLSARIFRSPDPDPSDVSSGRLPELCLWIEDRFDKRLPHESRALVCHWRTPICRVLPIAPSACRTHARRVPDPSGLSDPVMRDAGLRPRIQRVRDPVFKVYGVRKLWRQLNRQGTAVAR